MFSQKATSVKSPENRHVSKISTIFLVALAVRKFQRFRLNCFKKSLEYRFDKQSALEELMHLYGLDETFFKQEFVKLANFIRKFFLTFEELSSCESGKQNDNAIVRQMLEQLNECCNKNAASFQKLNYFLSLSLKYLTKNSPKPPLFLKISCIAKLLHSCYCPHITAELVALTGYLVEKSHDILNESLISELETLVLNLPELSKEVKELFFSKLKNKKAGQRPIHILDQNTDDNTVRLRTTVRNVKKNEQVVTKTIQTVKVKHETKESEETDFKFLRLSDYSRTRNRRKKANTVLEKLNTEKDGNGSDMSIWRTTWAEVIYLFSLASQNQPLKAYDKDNYLPNRFLGLHYYFHSSIIDKWMYSFFINRMCASIFCKVSRKQQLNNTAIDKLMKCITRFDSLVYLLNLNGNFMERFVDLILLRYRTLKAITGPDIVVKFLKTIRDETTEEYVSKGWISWFDKTKVRKKSFNKTKVEKIIAYEINQVRLDAIKAVYHCATKDKKILTKVYMKKINDCIKHEGEKHFNSDFRRYILKLVKLAESLDDFDYADVFQTYIKQLKHSSRDTEDMLEFINNQARDLKRSQELFTEDVLTILIEMISNSSVYSSRQKASVLDIINIYLEHELTKSLNEESLEKLLGNVLESNDPCLINYGLTSVWLSADKTHSLPSYVIKSLLENFDHTDTKRTSFILFILSRAFLAEDSPLDSFLIDSCDIEIISYKLHCDHVAYFEDESSERIQLKFEKPSENSGQISTNFISLLAAKVIMKSTENKIRLSAVTVENLILALHDTSVDHKQAKIVAAKCLYKASKYMSFENGDLTQMLDLINDAIYDVGVYTQAAYMNGCVKLAFKPDTCLDPVHMENFSSLFILESLKIGSWDYKEEINKQFFKILLYEARKQILTDEKLFHLFEDIVNLNEKYATQTLDILRVYTLNNDVPNSTVKTLENALNTLCLFDKALSVLQNIILRGKSQLTSKTLSIFINYLYTSVNSHLRFSSFKILEKVGQNQEMADDVFRHYELVKAGYALEYYAQEMSVIGKLSTIDYIQRETAAGLQLPIDAMVALEKETCEIGTLKIFANISKHRQIIPPALLDKLIKMFDPESKKFEENILLINIFKNVAKINQPLPAHLLQKLDNALHKEYFTKEVLPVFIFLAQKGVKLHKDVNHTLLDSLMKEEDTILQQELLSSLGSLIIANQQDIAIYKTKISQILCKEINSENVNIQKLCISALDKFVKASKQIDDVLLHEIVQFGTEINTSPIIRNQIFSLFQSLDIKYNPIIIQKCYKQKIKLANLRIKSKGGLLLQLNRYVDLDDGFLEQNYMQLQEIIDSDDLALQQKAINLLNKCKSKSGITDALLESVAILYAHTLSEDLKACCLHLFKEVVKCGKTLKDQAFQLWNEEINRCKNIQKFYGSKVCRELKQHYQLNDKRIAELLENIKSVDDASKTSSVCHLIELITQEDPLYYNNRVLVLIIEQCLCETANLEIILPFYSSIVKQKKCLKVEKCLTVLAEYLDRIQTESNINNIVAVQFLDVLCSARDFIELPPSGVKFAESNLSSSNKTARWYAFKCLRKYQSNNEHFQVWCLQLKESLEENKINISLKGEACLDWLEIITSLKFLDFTVFKTNEKLVWKRELLLSSLFGRFKVHKLDHMDFYTNWLKVEEQFGYHKSCKILIMIQISKFDSFAQIVEMMSILPAFTFDETLRLLSIHLPAPHRAIKEEWCIRQIQACVVVRDGINQMYLMRLSGKICAQFDSSVITKILSCIKSIDNLRAFEDLIQFCTQEKIKLDTLVFDDLQLSDLRCFVEANCLVSVFQCETRTTVEDKNLLLLILSLLNDGWNFSKLKEIIYICSFQKMQQLTDILSIIQNYKLSASSSFKQCKEIMTETKSFTEALRKFNKLAISNHFQLEGKIKGLSELLAELETSNQKNPSLAEFIRTGSLNIRQNIFEMESAKLHWNEKQIRIWAEEVKLHKRKFTDYEAIAVILRANYLVTGHTLTDTQILCSLIALHPDATLKGKLLEVATGEGKSTIICILAIINALRGKQVDVITSSPILAARDAYQKAKLYRMFNLTCSNNNDSTVYLKGVKDCYMADIVYVELSQFQFDILRNDYSNLGTLGDRKCNTAIVDEVDSMLIDDSSKIARLSAAVGGMDHFQHIYVLLWQRLMTINDKFMMCHGQLYYINGNVGFENGHITLEVVDIDSNDILKIPDIESYIGNGHDISRIGEEVGDDIEEYLRKSLEMYLNSKIVESQVFIPSNFIELYEKQKRKWILNAIEALNYQENVHYVVQDGQIKPVDYYSTGIVQSSTNWSDGLHQFLQLKHNLKMTSETLTTNFLSNIGFINKYMQVYGLTGTMGSQSARKVLETVYRVAIINIPQQRQKQYYELDPIVVKGNTNWMKQIVSSLMLEIQTERGVLVICETIQHANTISQMLKSKLRSSAVKAYTMNDNNQEKCVEKIMPGEVIVATNLAGRGTDIDTDDIETFGGLHVILTFLPNNQRVEDQAFGRTARQGKRGTGQMILNAQTLGVYSNTTKSNIKEQREIAEANQLAEFQSNELKLIKVKDKLFDRFCHFLNEIRLAVRQKHNSFMTQVFSCFTDVMPSVYETNVLAAVEEQWAFFFNRIDDGTVKCDYAEREYRDLIAQLTNDFKNDTLIKNPYHFTCIAYDEILNQKAKTALENFTKAIMLEEKEVNQNFLSKHEEKTKPLFGAGAAHLGIAWCCILLKEDGYKDKALDSFKNALQCLSEEMSLLNSTQIMLEQTQTGFMNSDLYKQLNVKSTILGSYLNGTQNCISAIKYSKRLIDVVATEICMETDDEILKRVTYFNDVERSEQKLPQFKGKDLKVCDEKQYTLIFNSLTTRDDCGNIDQAICTLNNAFTKGNKLSICTLQNVFTKRNEYALDDKQYNDLQIHLKQVDLARISTLLNPDLEFLDLTKDAAVQKLKKERSYLHAGTLNVDLKIYSTERQEDKEQFNGKQINEVIMIIEDQPNSLRFDIIIKNGNKNNLIDHLKKIQLNVCFDEVDQSTALDKLSKVKANSVDISSVMNKGTLLELINRSEQLESGQLLIKETNVYKTFRRKELLKHIMQLKSDTCYIKFEGLSLEQANTVTRNCQDCVLLTVCFNNISNYYESGLDDGQVNCYFDKLNYSTAKQVIEVLRKNLFEFSLEFANLSKQQFKFVLKYASLDQQEIEISKVKCLQELFMRGSVPTMELTEFAAKGIEYFIEINERRFVPWRSIVAVAVLGLCQVIVGGALIATGFGTTVGMALVTEGLADIFVSYRAYRSRQFNWSDYCKQKAVSLAISAISMGFSSVKDAAKGVKTVAAGVGKEALEQAATQVVTNRKTVGAVMVATGKNLKKLTYKYVAVKAGETVVREGLNTGIQCLSNFSFEIVKPKICESIQEKVKTSFGRPDLMRLLRKMYAVDLTTDSNKLQSKVEDIVAETLNPKHSFFRQQWESIALPLLKGILSSSSKYGSGISMSIRIIGTLNGLYEVQGLVRSVVDELISKLDMMDRNTMAIDLVLSRSKKVNKDTALKIVNKLKSLGIFDEFYHFAISDTYFERDVEEIKRKLEEFTYEWKNNKLVILKELNPQSSKMEDDLNNSITFVESLLENYSKVELNSFDMMMKSVSDTLTDHLIGIIDSQLIQPWSTLAVSNLTSKMSAQLQHHCLVSREQNTDSQNKDQEKHEALLQKTNLTAEEKAFVQNYSKYRTFTEQINYNAKDYCIAYSQCEMAYYPAQEINSDKCNAPNKQAKEAAEDVRYGKAATLGVMLATAKANGINLKIVDNKDYVKTKEDCDNNTEVVYTEQDQNNEVGHAYYLNSKGEFISAQGQGNDCYFAAMRDILKNRCIDKSTEQLRSDAAQHIEQNSKHYTKVLDAERWVRERHPNVANDLLFTVGLYKDKTGRIRVEPEDIVKLYNSVKKDKDRGGIYKKFFQEMIDKVDDYDDDESVHKGGVCHHIIPNKQIEEELILQGLYVQRPVPTAGGKSMDTNNLKPSAVDQVEHYLNQDHIKKVIGHVVEGAPQEEHGKLIHAAISWNPHNIVRGPDPRFRSDDPKSGIEVGLLKHQTPEYQKAVAPFLNKDPKNPATLKDFGGIPRANPVKQVKGDDDKYSVPEVTQNSKNDNCGKGSQF